MENNAGRGNSDFIRIISLYFLGAWLIILSSIALVFVG